MTARTKTTGAAASADLAALAVMEREPLLELWRELFQGPPPKRLSMPFLRRFIAFELQSRRRGGLDKAMKTQLAALASGKARKTAPRLRPGGRLIREWNGTSHVVDVTEAGFTWRGRSYRSLSAIAREITGAHWSGPRFFGFDEAGAR